MDTVCVLMSTYNGEKYLVEQIESILNQKRVIVYLFVRDDGSTDNTVDILKKYKSENKLEVYQDDENLGPANSFMKLLYDSSDYDYYAFADQDDIWLEEKLFVAIQKIKEKNSLPTLYCSNQLIYKDNRVGGVRFLHEPEHGLIEAICGNVFSGCTMVFNKELADIIKKKQHRPNSDVLRMRMHDTWVIAVAECIGDVIYDQNAYIKYRIHENNTVGLKKGKVKRVIEKLIGIQKKGGRSKLASNLIKITKLKDNKAQIVCAFAERNRIKLLKKEIINQCGENRMIFVIKVLLGWI